MAAPVVPGEATKTRPGLAWHDKSGLGRAAFFVCLTAALAHVALQDMLERVAKEKGLNYEEWVEGLKHKNQWHVEVY